MFCVCLIWQKLNREIKNNIVSALFLSVNIPMVDVLSDSLANRSSRIFDNVIAKWTFCLEQFFSAKSRKSSYYKN